MTDSRHHTRCCAHCRSVTDLFHCRTVDEYLCDDCIMDLAKEAYDAESDATDEASADHFERYIAGDRK